MFERELTDEQREQEIAALAEAQIAALKRGRHPRPESTIHYAKPSIRIFLVCLSIGTSSAATSLWRLKRMMNLALMVSPI